MTKNRILSILLLVLMAFPALAQKDQFNPVYTGVTSLSIAPDARAGALGDVGVATEPDANSQEIPRKRLAYIMDFCEYCI